MRGSRLAIHAHGKDGCSTDLRRVLFYTPGPSALMACDLWDRQPNETTRAYALFAVYRDAGPIGRTYPKVARAFGLAMSTVKTVSQRKDWVARAAAWDAETERIKRNTMIRDLKSKARRQVLTGQLFQSKATKLIQGMTDDEVMRMSVYEALRLYEVGERIERHGRGEMLDLIHPYRHENDFVGATAETPIIEILRRDPTRAGPVVDLLIQIQNQLSEVLKDQTVYDTPKNDELRAFLKDDAEAAISSV